MVYNINTAKIGPSLEIVKWVDHSSFAEATWRPFEAYTDGETFVVFSVGWVIYEDKEVVVLLSTASRTNEKGFGDMKILKKAIQHRWKINDPSVPRKRKVNRKK